MKYISNASFVTTTPRMSSRAQVGPLSTTSGRCTLELLEQLASTKQTHGFNRYLQHMQRMCLLLVDFGSPLS